VIVVDTSAVVAALAGHPAVPGLAERLSAEGDLHAPYLLDLEFIQALRRLEAARELTTDRARDALTDLADLTITRYPHLPLADRVWSLRANLSAYDAAFVALAEALEVPLVTCDARLARAPGHGAAIEVFTP
jgi:predicted nucleic acid-binding protein